MHLRPLKGGLPKELLMELSPLGMDEETLARDIRHNFTHTLGCDRHSNASHHVYTALAMILRDRLMERWQKTHYSYQETGCKRGYYFSLEFLMGRMLGNALFNLGLSSATSKALHELGLAFGRDSGYRGRCRTRQRWPGSLGSLFSR